MPGAAQELEIIVRFRDLLSKGLGRAQRALLSFTALGSRGMKAMTRAVGVMRDALFGLPGILTAIATGGVALLARAMIEAASDAEETASRFRISFGQIAVEAETAAIAISGDMGRSVTEIRNSMADFGSLLSTVGFGEEEALDASTALAQLAIDLGSFQNVSDERASEALRSGLLGEAEALKSLNIFVNEATVKAKAYELGIADVGAELSDQQKVLARLAVIMEGNSLAHGDAARTSDSYANATKRLLSQVTGLREEMGTRLIEVIGKTMHELGGEAVVLEVVRSGFELVVIVASELIKASGKVIKITKGIIDTLDAQGGSMQFVAKVGGFLGTILETAFALAETAVRGFEQGIDVVVFAAKALWNILQLVVGVIGLILLDVLQLGVRAWGMTAKAIQWVINVLRDGLLVTLDVAVGAFVSLFEVMRDTFAWLGDNVPFGGEMFIGLANSIDSTIASVEGFNAEMQNVGDFSGLDNFIAKAEAADVKVQELQSTVAEFVLAQIGDLGEATNAFAEDIMKDAEATQEALSGLLDGLSSLGAEGYALSADIENLLAAFESFDATSANSTDQAQLLADALARLKIDFDALKGNLENFDTKKSDTALQTFLKDAGDVGAQLDKMAAGSLQNFTNGLSGAFTDVITGTKSAKEAFGDFARQFIAQTVQMIVQMLILRAVSAAFGFADGGVVPGGTGEFVPLANGGVVPGGLGTATPVHGYANGGPLFTKPHVALIGEGQYNEAVVPLPDGRRIPVDMRGGGEGGATINFNISMVDATGVDQLLMERRRTIEDVVSNGMSTRRSFRSTMGGGSR